jgi:hypothetical protein
MKTLVHFWLLVALFAFGCGDDGDVDSGSVDAAVDATVDVAQFGACEQLAAYMQITVVPGGPAIATATVTGCRASISPATSCAMPAMSLQVVSTEQTTCFFTLTSTIGQVFTFSSQVKTLPLSTPYKCSSNGIHEVDTYRAFVPASVIVDFAKADAGTTDALPLLSTDGGTNADTASCQ